MTNGPIRQDSGHLNLTYNSRNQLTSADGLSYTYDAEGVRRTITSSTGTTRDVTDPNSAMSRLLVRNHPDGTKTYYVYGLGLLYEVNQAEQTKTYHYDQVGSTILRTNDAGVVIGSAECSAYGICFWKQGDMATPFQYNGQWGIQTDANGLLSMRARYYSPYLMRFLNADPIGFSGGSNWFAYADGNPISNSDPFGLWSWNQTWGVVKAVGGILEVAGGISLATGTGGIGAVGGYLIAAHGLDTFQAGIRQAMSGDETDTGTSLAIQSAGVSRNTANLVDSGIGLAGGVASLRQGAMKTAEIMSKSEAAGMSTWQALRAWDKGSSGLTQASWEALGEGATNALQKYQMMRDGVNLAGQAFKAETSLSGAAGQVLTGMTPRLDLFLGGYNTTRNSYQMLK